MKKMKRMKQENEGAIEKFLKIEHLLDSFVKNIRWERFALAESFNFMES